jgi:methylated-DNA-[protein]-cysteine S-methyltransferase
VEKVYRTNYESPIGCIEIAGTREGILSIEIQDGPCEDFAPIPECLKDCVLQLHEYFQGTRREFSLDLVMQGTDFQKKVWVALTGIPFGQTASYKDIAEAIGNIKGVRAVGNANGRNRIAIVIPCHRVIGSTGNLVGFASGLWRKQWLLNHEKEAS